MKHALVAFCLLAASPAFAVPACDFIGRARPPQPMSVSAAEFNDRLAAIAKARDLKGFLSLATPETLASFGGHSGPEGLREVWIDGPEASPASFWAMLDRLIAAGPSETPATQDWPEGLVYPWTFEVWDGDQDPFAVWFDRKGGAWLDTEGGCGGAAAMGELSPLIGPRLIAQKTGAGWRIEALVEGD